MEVCPQMPALYLELALILTPGHVGCDRRREQTLLECRQPRVLTRPPVALTGSDSGTSQTGQALPFQSGCLFFLLVA